MKKHLFPILISLAMAGCASIPLEPGAASVRILKKEPKGCKYLGDITGSQGNFFTGPYTSNANLETGARNDLKNKAHKMGGNAVVLITQRAADTFQSGGSGQQTNVVLSGSVFKCPESVLDNL